MNAIASLESLVTACEDWLRALRDIEAGKSSDLPDGMLCAKDINTKITAVKKAEGFVNFLIKKRIAFTIGV